MTLSAGRPIPETPVAGVLPGFVEASIAALAVALCVLMMWTVHDIGPLSRSMAAGTGALVLWIAWQDLRTFTIPDGAVASLAALAIGYRWSLAIRAGTTPIEAAASIAFDAVIPGLLLLAFREIYFRRRGFDGIGLGDVKLSAAGALLVGTIGFSWALFAASFTGLISFGLKRLFAQWAAAPRPGGMDRIAFGALLAPAFWMVWMSQNMAVLLPPAWR